MEDTNKVCRRCKHRGDIFLIPKPHNHCENTVLYNQETFDRGDFVSGWDTVRETDKDSCELFELAERFTPVDTENDMN